MMEQEYYYSVDQIITKSGVIFGFGWLFAVDEVGIEELWLLVRDDEQGVEGRVRIEHGSRRSDVATVFPQYPQSGDAGFFFYGRAMASSADNLTYTLEVRRPSGEIRHLVLPKAPKAEGLPAVVEQSSRGQLFLRLLKKAWMLLRKGRIRDVMVRTRKYLKRAPALEGNPVARLVQLLPDDGCDVCLIIDHDLGGGCNTYRKKLVGESIKQGRVVLLLTYHLASLQYVLQCIQATETCQMALEDLTVLQELAGMGRIGEVIYNTGVSFVTPELIPAFLVQMKKTAQIQVRIMLHDYYSLCPSHFLINHLGRYCDLPHSADCSSCLQQHQDGLVSLFGQRDINLWRSVWRLALESADEIRCFSAASRNLLLKVYPQLLGNVTVIPHTLDHFQVRERVRVSCLQGLHIGILGQIGMHKGAAIVKGLAEAIVQKQLAVKMTVIGSLDIAGVPALIRETGPYRPEQLPELIRNSGINLFLFPSIWPETFSYVTEELMALGVPVVSFDLGAPAERLRQYELGHVIPFTENGEVLLANLNDVYRVIENAAV